MRHSENFRFAFRVLGDCRQPRRLVDAGAALAGYAACDTRCELERESYLSAFQFAGAFRKHLERTGSTAGFSGACWSPWVWFDIDNDGDLPAALDAARRLCVFAGDKLGVRDDDILCFFSGSKGFHVGLPTSLWAPSPGTDFHKVARRFAETVAEQAEVAMDSGVYDRVRVWRAPNSRHPRTGLHKRRLTVDALMRLSIDAILRLAENPEPFELPAPTYRSEPVADLWRQAAEQVRREAEAKSQRTATGNCVSRLNRGTLAFIRDGASTGDRHRLAYSAAANLAELGAPLGLCVALLEETALDSGLPPMDVRRAISNGWASVQPGSREAAEVFGGTVVAVRLPEDAEPGQSGGGKDGGS